MSIIKLNQGYRLLVNHRLLLAPTPARMFDIRIGLPEVRTNGLMYGHVITKFLGWQLSFFRCGGRARSAPLLSVFEIPCSN